MRKELSEVFTTLFEIPGYSDYLIDFFGSIFNRKRGEFLSGSRNPAGYWNFRIIDDEGVCRTWGRHRLMAYIFIPCKSNVDDLYVNHINGIKGDDRLENLEWVTPQENCHHAGHLGITDKCTPVAIRNIHSGEEARFNSATECADSLGLTKDAVLYRLSIGEERVFPDGNQYRRGWSDKPWVVPEDVEAAMKLNGREKAIRVKELLTGEEFEMKKSSHLATYLGMSPATISNWMAKEGQPVLPGLIMLKYSTDTTPWREVTDPYFELSQTTGKRPVEVLDRDGKVLMTFETLTDCSRELDLNVTTLHQRLKSNGERVYRSGHRFRYYSTSNQKNSPTV